MSRLPDRIGRYEILAELGRGGMGTVFRARDPVLDRVVALKVMAGGILIEPGMRERFLREARSAARLQHPGIVTIFEFGEVGDAPFIAMELLEGDELAVAVEQGRLPELASRLGVVEQACEALFFAHTHGVVHRDVKPANIFLLRDGIVKIVDFGIAWLEGGAKATRTGILLGTPGYMAPEQFAGDPVDHRVDQWALGIILYELISGRRPFDAPTVPSLIYQVLHKPPAPLDHRLLRVPAQLVEIVWRVLAKDPAQRFPDLGGMGRALRQVQAILAGVDGGSGEGAAPPELLVDPVPEVAASAVGVVTSRPGFRPPTAGHLAFVDDGIFGETRRLQAALLSPDDLLLAAGGTDGAIHVWEVATRSRITTLRNRVHLRSGHGSLTTALVFSDDGSLLASGHLDGAIYLWEVATGLELDVRMGHEGAVGGIVLPPGDATVISGGADATLKFWELPAVRKGDARRTIRRQPDGITCLGLAGQGRVVVSGHVGRSLRVHETTGEHRLVATIHGHKAPLAVLAVAPAGDLVASGARDGAVRLHHLPTRELRGSHQEHGRTLAGLCFFPDGRRLASVAMDSTVIVWDPAEPELPVILSGKPDESYSGVCVSQDGRRVLAACADGRFRVWRMVSS